MPKGSKMECGQKVISRSRNKAAIGIAIPALPSTAAYLCLHAYRYLLLLHTTTYVIAVGNKQAVIGSLPFWSLLAFFTDRGGANRSADMVTPGSQATVVSLWALYVCPGIA